MNCINELNLIANSYFMKRLLSFLALLLILTCLCSSSCKKDKNKNPVDQLPPETQTGANTFGCLVDGKAFKPAGSALSGPNLAGIYQYIYNGSPNGYVFWIKGTNKKDPRNITSVGFGFDSVQIQVGVYPLRVQKKGQGVGGISYYNDMFPIGNLFNTNEDVIGEMNLKKFDLTNQIASGTFWFNAVNDKGDTVKITDGRFDVRFTR